MGISEIVSNSKHQRTAIGSAILALIAIYSARREVFPDLLPADVLLGLVTQALIVMFCVADSHVIGKRLVHSFRWIIFFTWPISVPMYLLWTRGLKGFLHIALYLVLIIFVNLLVVCIAHLIK